VDIAANQILELIDRGQMTIEMAMDGFQISAYKRESGIEPLAATIYAWVVDLSNSLNVSMNLDARQVTRITFRIINEYWGIKLDEIAYFVNQAKRGDFGKSYNRLDEAIFFEWLEKYCQERLYICEQRNFAEVNEIPTKTEQEILDAYEKMRNAPEKPKVHFETKEKLSLRERLQDPAFLQWKKDNLPPKEEI